MFFEWSFCFQAKKKKIEKMSPDALGVDITPRIEVLKVEDPPVREAGIKVGDVDELVTKMKDKGFASAWTKVKFSTHLFTLCNFFEGFLWKGTKGLIEIVESRVRNLKLIFKLSLAATAKYRQVVPLLSTTARKNIHPFIIMVQNHFLVFTARILKSLIPLFSSQAV